MKHKIIKAWAVIENNKPDDVYFWELFRTKASAIVWRDSPVVGKSKIVRVEIKIIEQKNDL